MFVGLIWAGLFPTHATANAMEETLEPLDPFVNVPIPKDKGMNEYSIPEKYENIPLSEIYSEKLGKENFEKLVGVIKQQETSNEHYKNGVVQVGLAGEVGLMQIKPLGNLGGGIGGSLKGIRRPVLENEDLNERVGRIHLINILGNKSVNYDIPSAIMAWNRGLGMHKKWIAKGRKQEELPEHTKNYLKSLRKVFPEKTTPSTDVPPISKEVAPAAPILKKAEENSFVSKPSITENGEDTTTQDYPRPYGRIFPELMDEKTIAELTQQTGLDQHELWNKATESFIKFPNDLEKARLYFLKDMITDPKEGLNVNVITQENFSFTSKLNKKEGGFVSA